MSNKATYLLGIIASCIVGCYLYTTFCCSTCENCETPKPVTNYGTKYTNPFTLKGKGIDYQSPINFNFLKSDFNAILPVDESVINGITKLNEAFLNNRQFLKITGYARKEEVNHSIFPNLGFARANTVKNYFVAKGISSTRIEINGEIKEDFKLYGDTLFGPVNFAISEISQDKSTADWGILKTQLNTPPLTLYFNTGESTIALTDDERGKITQMINYIDHVENATLEITGHTDNTGNAAKNLKLGQERADFAKNYLIKNGISGTKINSHSKGQTEPIYDNTTEDGKAKNRRTVIIIN